MTIITQHTHTHTHNIIEALYTPYISHIFANFAVTIRDNNTRKYIYLRSTQELLLYTVHVQIMILISPISVHDCSNSTEFNHGATHRGHCQYMASTERPRPTHRGHCQYSQPRPRPVRLTIIKANFIHRPTIAHNTHNNQQGQGQNTNTLRIERGELRAMREDFALIKMALGLFKSAQQHCTRGVRSAHSSFL